MERPWLKWESDFGASRRALTVPQNFEGKSGSVVEDIENASLGILVDDANPSMSEAGQRQVEIIFQDAAVDVSMLIFEEGAGDEERAEAIAELARNRVLDRK
jgi:hypothetical protein